VAEAYRRAAKDLEILPRQLQSIVWEAIRAMYPAKTTKLLGEKAQVWHDYDEQTARTNLAGQTIHPPNWAGRRDGAESAAAADRTGGDVQREAEPGRGLLFGGGQPRSLGVRPLGEATQAAAEDVAYGEEATPYGEQQPGWRAEFDRLQAEVDTLIEEGKGNTAEYAQAWEELSPYDDHDWALESLKTAREQLEKRQAARPPASATPTADPQVRAWISMTASAISHLEKAEQTVERTLAALNKARANRGLSPVTEISEAEAPYYQQALPFFTEPTNEQTHADPKGEAEKSLVSLERGGSIVGNLIAADFRENTMASIIGTEVNTYEDLAAAASVLRNPSFETMRVFFVKGDKIISENAYTSRMSGS